MNNNTRGGEREEEEGKLKTTLRGEDPDDDAVTNDRRYAEDDVEKSKHIVEERVGRLETPPVRVNVF